MESEAYAALYQARLRLGGKQHEVCLFDTCRTALDRLQTVIRQPAADAAF